MRMLCVCVCLYVCVCLGHAHAQGPTLCTVQMTAALQACLLVKCTLPARQMHPACLSNAPSLLVKCTLPRAPRQSGQASFVNLFMLCTLANSSAAFAE